MARFTYNGISKGGTDSEEFDDAINKEAGSVECSVCKIKLGQGIKAGNMKECIEYVCDEHLYRHPKCSKGR